jgi:predicted phosphate transport protein (TIGR00153 family)
MAKVAECAGEVPTMIERLAAGDHLAVAAQRDRIAHLEHEADALKNDIRNHLPKRMFQTVDRRDLLEILDLQDAIANVSEDLADLLSERRFEVPSDMQEPLLRFVRRSVDVVRACRDVMKHLDDLVERGFSGPDADAVLAHVDAVLKLEDETDGLLVAARKGLFAHEGELSAVTVMLWLQMFDWIGDLADNGKSVCNRVRLLVAS